jgi:hypothetical protein
MAPPSPARLYATLLAAALVALGFAGFFFSLSWLNFLYVASGFIGLLLAPAVPRAFALLAGVAYTGLAIFTFAHGGWLHLAIGLLGLAAYAGTPRPQRRSKPADRSKPRAQAAGKSA